jgi:uncharacterized protein YuzE
MASISVDFDANAMYVSLSKDKKVKETISLGEDRFIDVAEDGTVIGVEILLPKKMPLEAKEAFLRSQNEIKVTQ